MRHHDGIGWFAGYRYCTRCGLFWLKNFLSRKALSNPCPGAE